MRLLDPRLLAMVFAGLLAYGLVNGQVPTGLDADPVQPLPLRVQMVAQAPVQPLAPAPQQAVQTQAQPPATQTPAAAPAPAPAASTKVDETALRYFARQGDSKRVEAEIARLKSLYPDWQPPTNLLSNDYVPDPAIEHIWELYGQGDYAGARAAIAAKKASDPTFIPSDDLLHSLDVGEAGVRLRNASDNGQYETVVSVAANTPDLLTCDSVDNLWRLAEAFIKTDRKPRGIDAYTYILKTCTDSAIRLSTLQKAMTLLERADLQQLLALERPGPDGGGEFKAVKLDLARTALSDVLTGKLATASDADVALLESEAKTSKTPDDLRLLGWYALNRKQPEMGRDWFQMAVAADPSELSAHGLGVAYLDLEQFKDAEETLAPYRDDDAELTGLYLSAAAALLAQDPPPKLDAPVLARIVEAASKQHDANTGQELGWYAYGFQQPQTAISWFRLTLGWDATNEPAAYGLLVASDALKDTATVAEIKAQWRGKSERIADFGQAQPQQTTAPIPASPPPATVRNPVVQQVATASPPRPQPNPAPVTTSGGSGKGCVAFVPPQALSADQALARGWCLMDLNRPAEAVTNFARGLQSASARTRSDAAYGQALAYIRLGLPQDAAVAAASAPLSDNRIVELQVSIYTQNALRAYEVGDYRRTLLALDERARYAPEQNDLLTLRAWSYFHLGRYSESEQIFSAVAATGYRDAASGLAAARGALAARDNQ